MWQR
jgi:hypothetical protein